MARTKTQETTERKGAERTKKRSLRQQQQDLKVDRDRRLTEASNKHTKAIADHHAQLRRDHARIWDDYRAAAAALTGKANR